MAYTTPDGVVHMGASAATGAAAGTAILPGIGTAIGAGLGVLGGFLSSKSNRENTEAGIAAQREALQNQVQWRVADAKKAGIHPLYALGMPPANISAVYMPDTVGPAVADAGQQIGQVIASQQTQREKLIQALQLDMLQSQARRARSEADIVELESFAAMTRQNQNGLGIHNEGEQVDPMGQVPAVRGTEVPGAAEMGWYERKAPQRMSPSAKMPGWESQYGPAYQEWELFPGFYLTTPMTGQESWREVLSEMSPAEKFGLINQNATVYGSPWFSDFVKWEYFGIKPQHKYQSASASGGNPKIPRGERGRQLYRYFKEFGATKK